jgi:dihydroflavonol-4-reductase
MSYSTLRVLKAAHAANVKRFILTSSVAAVMTGHPARSEPFTEEDWTNLSASPPVPPYPKSKTLAERAAWDWLKENGQGMELVAVNPVAILGPMLTSESKTSILFIKKLMDGSVPGCPALYVDTVDVRDVSILLWKTWPPALLLKVFRDTLFQSNKAYIV